VPPSSTTTTVAAPPSGPGYNAARQQWQAAASAASYQQSGMWSQAAQDLENGKATDSGTSGYTAAIAELHAMAALPETTATPTEKAEAQQDTASLDAFFDTPGLYGT
jgi:hypothetical protein